MLLVTAENRLNKRIILKFISADAIDYLKSTKGNGELHRSTYSVQKRCEMCRQSVVSLMLLPALVPGAALNLVEQRFWMEILTVGSTTALHLYSASDVGHTKIGQQIHVAARSLKMSFLPTSGYRLCISFDNCVAV